MNMSKFKYNCIKVLQFLLNPRFVLCFGIGWLITNGWSYIFMAIGTLFQIEWMMVISGAYLTFLWLPISPEKLVTLAIAIFLLKRLFPNDEKTLGVLISMRNKVKAAAKRHKAQHHAHKDS